MAIRPGRPVGPRDCLMLPRRWTRLAAVDEEGRLLGMLSRFGVLETATNGFARTSSA